MVPGTPGACGDDCDDTRASAFPGHIEVCDGVDNDCNGVVDDGAQYLPKTGATDVRVSSAGLAFALPSGLAQNDAEYFATYTASVSGKGRVLGIGLDLDGKATRPEERLTQVESDQSGGSIAWTGDRYGVVWSDRRFFNYESFFALFDRHGVKMAPGDVRVTDSGGFSINAQVVWTGTTFVVVWQEGDGGNGTFQILAQRIGLDGVRIGETISLSTATGEESPVLAVGRPGLGLAWVRGNASVHRVLFAPYTFDLKPNHAPIELTPPNAAGVYPTIVWNRDAFVVAWYEPGGSNAVFAAAVDGAGTIQTPAKKISDSPRFARDPSILALGDRLLMVYADARDRNSGYELYTRMISRTLDPIGNPARMTTSPGDSVQPQIAFGPQGEVGVLFRDDRPGTPQTYFTHLVCSAGNGK